MSTHCIPLAFPAGVDARYTPAATTALHPPLLRPSTSIVYPSSMAPWQFSHVGVVSAVLLVPCFICFCFFLVLFLLLILGLSCGLILGLLLFLLPKLADALARSLRDVSITGPG